MIPEDENEQIAQSEATVPDSEVSSLESLLKEYEEDKPEAPVETPTVEVDRTAVLEARLDRQDTEREITQIAQSADMPDEVVRPYVYGRVQTEPALQKAWQQRIENPQGWAKIRDALANEVSSRFQAVDQASTDDHDAVVAAVAGASTVQSTDGEPDPMKMSNKEWAEYKRAHGVKPYGT